MTNANVLYRLRVAYDASHARQVPIKSLLCVDTEGPGKTESDEQEELNGKKKEHEETKKRRKTIQKVSDVVRQSAKDADILPPGSAPGALEQPVPLIPLPSKPRGPVATQQEILSTRYAGAISFTSPARPPVEHHDSPDGQSPASPEVPALSVEESPPPAPEHAAADSTAAESTPVIDSPVALSPIVTNHELIGEIDDVTPAPVPPLPIQLTRASMKTVLNGKHSSNGKKKTEKGKPKKQESPPIIQKKTKPKTTSATPDILEELGPLLPARILNEECFGAIFDRLSPVVEKHKRKLDVNDCFFLYLVCRQAELQNKGFFTIDKIAGPMKSKTKHVYEQAVRLESALRALGWQFDPVSNLFVQE